MHDPLYRVSVEDVQQHERLTFRAQRGSMFLCDQLSGLGALTRKDMNRLRDMHKAKPAAQQSTEPQRHVPKIHADDPGASSALCPFCARGSVDNKPGEHECPYCKKKVEVVRPAPVRTRRQELADHLSGGPPLFGRGGRFYGR